MGGTFALTSSSVQVLWVCVVGLRYFIPLPQQAAGTPGGEAMQAPGVVPDAEATLGAHING